MTYIVRPVMHPAYSPRMIFFISSGSIQLLVGPASFSSREQMNVRSSTRATSVGSVRAQNELGFLAGSSGVKVPDATRASVSSVHSSSEPVHQCTRSGVVMAATSSTQAARRAWVVGEPVEPLGSTCRSLVLDVVSALMRLASLRAVTVDLLSARPPVAAEGFL